MEITNDPSGIVLNVFESVDIITLIKGGNYEELSLTVGEALQKRNGVSFHLVPTEHPGLQTKHSQDFSGICTCSPDDGLDTIFDTIRKSRVHRLVVVDEENHLKGILTLSDILQYILLEGEADE